jgi:hypothetical protein
VRIRLDTRHENARLPTRSHQKEGSDQQEAGTRGYAATRMADAHAGATRNRSFGNIVETICISIVIGKAN